MERKTLVKARRTTLDFCLKHSIYPHSLDRHLKTDIVTDKYPCQRGGSSDVYFGRLNGKPVALKRFRSFQHSDERDERVLRKVRSPFTTELQVLTFLQKFINEAMITRALDHEHTIPFLTVQDNESGLYIVTPWMENGNVVQYVKAGPSGLEEKMVRLFLIHGRS